MKYLELTEFAPPPSKEYVVEAYPGPGNYLLPSGMIVLVHPMPTPSGQTLVGNWVQPGVKVKVGTLATPASAPVPAPGGIDVHRFLDQMITLTK